MPDTERPNARPYLIKDLIPETGLHLIAGPSGAGKTTWQFQMLQAFLEGEPVLDHPVMPGPVFYIAADRDEDEIEETMWRVGIKPGSFPYISLLESSWGVDEVLAKIPRDTKLIMIEGIASMVEGGKLNDYRIVADFIKTIRKASKAHRYSVLGSVHATKTKEGERFENPRQRILGSVAWAAFSGNVILIEPEKPSRIADNGRILLELPRNSPQIEHRFVLDSRGRFVPSLAAPEEAPRLMVLSMLPRTAAFTRGDAIYIAKDYNVSDGTIDRWLKTYIREGHIVKIDGGYVRTAVPLADQEAGKVLPVSVSTDTLPS